MTNRAGTGRAETNQSGRAEEVIGVLCDVLNMPPGALDVESLLGAQQGWDSMGTLRAVTCLETDLGVRLDLRAVHRARTVGDLVALAEAARP
ncbi:acyl carrier protein [Actinomadura sp. GTD37]|uniref:acyl carrier protein n=1 Tax=Actinomadura sp. GTD37 TaxID=1778030 RepID=UPI0035BF8977